MINDIGPPIHRSDYIHIDYQVQLAISKAIREEEHLYTVMRDDLPERLNMLRDKEFIKQYGDMYTIGHTAEVRKNADLFDEAL